MEANPAAAPDHNKESNSSQYLRSSPRIRSKRCARFLLVAAIRQNIGLASDGWKHRTFVVHQAVHRVIGAAGKESHGYSSPSTVLVRSGGLPKEPFRATGERRHRSFPALAGQQL